MPADTAGFLHSEEIRKLKVYSRTDVPDSLYGTLGRLYRGAELGDHPFLKRFLSHPDQLWHLIWFHGFTAGKPEDFDLAWLVNVKPDDVRCLDDMGNTISDETLRDSLAKLFPRKCMLTPKKWQRFCNKLEGPRRDTFDMAPEKPEPEPHAEDVMAMEVGSNQAALPRMAADPNSHQDIVDAPMCDRSDSLVPLEERLAPVPGRCPTKDDFDGGLFYRDGHLHKKIRKILRTKGRCLIIGRSGCGKTSLALSVGYEYSKTSGKGVYYLDVSREPDTSNWPEAIGSYSDDSLIILDNVHHSSEALNNLLCNPGACKPMLLVVARSVSRSLTLSRHPDGSGNISYLDMLRAEKAMVQPYVASPRFLSIVQRLAESGRISPRQIGSPSVLLGKCQGNLHILRLYVQAWARRGKRSTISDVDERAILDDLYRTYFEGKPYEDELLRIAALSHLQISVDSRWIRTNIEAVQKEGLLDFGFRSEVEPTVYVTWLRICDPAMARYLLLAAAYHPSSRVRSVEEFTVQCLQDYLSIGPCNLFEVYHQVYTSAHPEWQSRLLNASDAFLIAKSILQRATPKYIRYNIHLALDFITYLMRLGSDAGLQNAHDLMEVLLSRVTELSQELTCSPVLNRLLRVADRLGVHREHFYMTVDFNAWGEKARDWRMGITTVKNFIHYMGKSGVSIGDIRAFCEPLDFTFLGEKARNGHVGLASIGDFVSKAIYAGVGDEKIRAFYEPLDFGALGEQLQRGCTTIATAGGFLGKTSPSWVRPEQIADFFGSLDFGSLGRTAREKRQAPISVGRFIRVALEADVPVGEIRSFCTELGSDLWAYTSVIAGVWTLCCRGSRDDIPDLLPDLPTRVWEDLLAKTDLEGIGCFLSCLRNKANAVLQIPLSDTEFGFLDESLPVKLQASRVGGIASFLLSFYYADRPALAHRFVGKVDERIHLVAPKLEKTPLAEIDLFLWNAWMCSRAPEPPRLFGEPDVIDKLQQWIQKKDVDLGAVLGICGTLNLAGIDVPPMSIPDHLQKVARGLCLEKAREPTRSHMLIRRCANDLHFSPIERELIMNALADMGAGIAIPNQELAIQRLMERLRHQAE